LTFTLPISMSRIWYTRCPTPTPFGIGAQRDAAPLEAVVTGRRAGGAEAAA